MADPSYLDPLSPSSGVLHDWNIVPPATKVFCAPAAERLARKPRPKTGPSPVIWTVSDLAKAGSLLCVPPLNVTFDDEQEMRRVYTLIYDVFRYKGILNQALNDIQFFQIYPELKDATSRIWLLLFDLYHRGFKKREPKNAALADLLFSSARLASAARTLWAQRVKLAASVARLRIESSALRLNELLPAHLRDERMQAHVDRTPVTCWVNYRKLRHTDDVAGLVKRILDVDVLTDMNGTLTPGTFKWCSHCPSFLMFHPSIRTRLAQSSLVVKNKLIVQDRAFCFGPATFGKILTNLQLTGSVIQSHVNSPRTTAYLASLLSYNEKIKKLLAFSAGHRKSEYDHYFSELGLKNVSTYSEKLSDVPPDATYLNEVIAVFATPPNSYTAVADPIDLVCSRGGDLSMLEVLTESENTPEGRQRVRNILDEQQNTLRYAMARPQIQLVLYETHSELDTENNAMVQKTINEINHIARMHHAAIQGKLHPHVEPEESDDDVLSQEHLLTGLNLAAEDSESIDPDTDEPGTNPNLVNGGARAMSEHSFGDTIASDVVVPDCDLFNTTRLPDLCDNPVSCVNILQEGCFLALLQRKVVIRHDHKYMIQMAETRGLFGNDGDIDKRKKTKKEKTKKADIVHEHPKLKRKGKEIEIERIAAPTQAFLHQSRIHDHDCKRCPREIDGPKLSPRSQQTRRWWKETAHHLSNLRVNLMKQKLISPLPAHSKLTATVADVSDKTADAASRAFVGSLIQNTQHRRIDEIVAARRGSRQSTALAAPNSGMPYSKEGGGNIAMGPRYSMPSSMSTTKAQFGCASGAATTTPLPPMPPFPRLRLTRRVKKIDKVPVPMAVTMVRLTRSYVSRNEGPVIRAATS